MKSFLGLCFFACLLTYGQTPSAYTVVRVVGKVESRLLKRELRTNDKIQANDQLTFGTSESYIYVISPQTGRKKISGVPDSAPREFLHLLESFVRPEYKSTSTRSISLQYLESLQNSLAFDTLLLLGDAFIEVNTEKLSLASPAVVKAWYVQNGKAVYQTISNARGFALDERSIFPTKPSTHPRVMVEYFENGTDDPLFNPGLLLAAFHPLYVNEEHLKSEVKALVSASPTKGYSALFLEIRGYLTNEYAGVQESNLRTWLKVSNLLTE